MVNGIFWRENYRNDKNIKISNSVSPGERRNLRGDRKAKSKYILIYQILTRNHLKK